MKLFIAGISGLLGLNLALQTRGKYEVTGCYLNNAVALSRVNAVPLDLTCYPSLYEILKEISPDVIVNAAAMTNVDDCEVDFPKSYELNVTIAQNLAMCSRLIGSHFVQISSDQLFDGSQKWYTEKDYPTPTNIYGKTKAQAEDAVLSVCPDATVIRTNFFGWGTRVKGSFSDWILTGLRTKSDLNLFHDVFFNPILVNHMIDVCLEMVACNLSGIFHVVGRERVSKFDFGMKLARSFGHDTTQIKPVSIDDFGFKATRPKEMTLDYTKIESILNVGMPDLDQGFEKLLQLRTEKWDLSLYNGLVDQD